MSTGKAKGTRDVYQRLWARVDRGAPHECWPWLGYCRPSGHGQIGRGGRLDGTHRVAWEWANGAIPVGKLVRHSCDNPPCCNPAHLLLGTIVDNARDAVERNRVARGFRLPHTRLSDEDVRSIRTGYWRHKNSSNARELAAHFGVTPEHITAIVRRAERKSA